MNMPVYVKEKKNIIHELWSDDQYLVADIPKIHKNNWMALESFPKTMWLQIKTKLEIKNMPINDNTSKVQ